MRCFLLLALLVARFAEGHVSKLAPPHLDSINHNERGYSSDNTISVNFTKSVVEVSDQFLSVTIDAGSISRNWSDINFTMPRVVNMAKGLSPAMLRVGGTSQDYLLFDKSGRVSQRSPNGRNGGSLQRSNFTMSPAQWDQVNEFVKAVGWDFIFGLNLLLRNNWPNGSWYSSNAEELMEYTASKGYTVNWELGNEPDLFSDLKVSAQQNAEDHVTLRSLVTDKSPKTRYIAGPDVATLGAYLVSFLETVKADIIGAATWHQYYENGHTALLPDFFTVGVLDKFISQALYVQRNVHQYQPEAELWLGETSSCYGGGAPGLSDTYVAGFMWLDKLGIAALTNHTRVFRQDFVGGSYSLLDADLLPLPDYWLSLLYKQLVGTTVLNVTGSLNTGRYIRAYAHCAKSPYSSGSVVLLLLNVNTYDTTATLLNKELASSPRDVYWLTPLGGSHNITSHQVTLNGKLLQLQGDNLPDLSPEQQAANSTISLPALSFGYYVFKEAMVKVCM